MNTQRPSYPFGRGNPYSNKLVARSLPCPTCKQPNKITPRDRARGYQCDDCANLEEGPC